VPIHPSKRNVVGWERFVEIANWLRITDRIDLRSSVAPRDEEFVLCPIDRDAGSRAGLQLGRYCSEADWARRATWLETQAEYGVGVRFV